MRLVELGDGVERGVRVLEFRTGTGFAFDVLVDRAFDIGRCELRRPGARLALRRRLRRAVVLRARGARLPAQLGRRPADHLRPRPRALHGRGHGRAVPLPGRSRPRTFGLHGRVSNRPARLAGYGERWEGDECVLWAEGEMLQASVFGEHLLLRRRIEARVGESRLTIHDEVENVGWDRTPHMFLYHVNVGFPVVDEGVGAARARALASSARGEHPVEGYATLDAPAAGVRRAGRSSTRSIAEPDGTVPVAIVNRALGIGAYEVFRQDQLPFHFIWRMLGEGTLRRRDRAVHEPHGGPPRRPGARRADRARPGREARLRPGARRARRAEAEIDAFAARGALERWRVEPRSRRQDVRRRRRQQGARPGDRRGADRPRARACCSSRATRPPPPPSSASDATPCRRRPRRRAAGVDAVVAAAPSLGGARRHPRQLGRAAAGATRSTSRTTTSGRAPSVCCIGNPIRLIRALGRSSREGASILFVTSSSVRVPIAGLDTSNVLRPGVAALVKCLALELGPRIRVNSIVPGRIDTERVRFLDERPGRSARASRTRSSGAASEGDPDRPLRRRRPSSAASARSCSRRRPRTSPAPPIQVDGGYVRAIP